MERLLRPHREAVNQRDPLDADTSGVVSSRAISAARSERRRLLALLTDQRTRPWWRRWFRGG